MSIADLLPWLQVLGVPAIVFLWRIDRGLTVLRERHEALRRRVDVIERRHPIRA